MTTGHNSGSEVRSLIERILRLKAEQDELGSDVRDIYKEAASRGYNKTALGKAVTAIRQRDKNPDSYETLSTDTDLYLHAYYGSGMGVAPHAHAPEELSETSPVPYSTGPRGVGSVNAVDEAPSAGTECHHDGQSTETRGGGSEPGMSRGATPPRTPDYPDEADISPFLDRRGTQ